MVLDEMDDGDDRIDDTGLEMTKESLRGECEEGQQVRGV